MSSSDRSAAGTAASAASLSSELTLTIGVGVTLLAALMPLLRVVAPGWWLFGAVVMIGAVLAAGYIARRFRVRAIAVTLIEAAVWLVLLTLVFGRGTALLGIIPTPDTFRSVPRLVDGAMQEVTLGAAPLESGVPLSFFIVGAVGLLAIVIDHVVLTARMPLLAAVGLISVSLIPAIAVPSDADVGTFVLMAAGILFLVRAETRTREERRAARPTAPPEESSVGVSAMAAGIGAIAVVVAVVVTPLLPVPEAEAGAGFGPAGNTINPSLELGNDLRQPRDTEVLRVRSDAPTAPYLRAVTLSEFTGNVWLPDSGRTQPLEPGEGLQPVAVSEDIRVTEYTTIVDVVDLTSSWLPVSFPAVEVNGLDGDWAALPYNRTVVSNSATSSQQDYEIVTHLPRPTLEQIRSTEARAGSVPDSTTALPAEMPAIIGELAAAVTAQTTNDYDALVELQRWFRGGEFDYSLEAPVEASFDGSGLEAVAQFLEVRSGYCVHFASSFALMARTLEMPSRIVVGYLPGTSTTDSEEGQTVHSVSSSQLHSWPEVFFEGIGWIPFEPTSGRGVPTTFAPASAPVTAGGTDIEPSAGPTPGAAEGPNLPDEGAPDPAGDAARNVGPAFNPLPVIAVWLGIIVVLATPRLLRELRRRSRVATARSGDASAAWRELQDTALDLGISVPGSETPRVLGARLVRLYGAPADAVGILIDGIERASYARGGHHQFGRGPQLADAVVASRAGLLEHAEPTSRVLALIAPRSLVVQPGSVYAVEAGARASAR